MDACLGLADYEIDRAWRKWNASQGVNLTQRPREPEGPPPKGKTSSGAEHLVRERQRSDARYGPQRSRSPPRSCRSSRKDDDRDVDYGRGRASETWQRHSHREDRGRSERCRRERRRGRASDESEFEEIPVEEPPRKPARDLRKPGHLELAEKGSQQKVGKDKEMPRTEARREPCHETAESSEYTYTYDASSTEGSKSPAHRTSAPSAGVTKPAAPEGQSRTKPGKQSAVKAAAVDTAAANPKAGGTAASSSGKARGDGADQRRMSLFNSLLRTAMETADSCGF